MEVHVLRSPTPVPDHVKARHLDLASRARTGDTAAVNALVSEFTPWVARQARRYAKVYGVDVEDLLQLGLLRLPSAIAAYDPGRSSVMHWCCWCAARTMLREARNSEAARLKIEAAFPGTAVDGHKVPDHRTDPNAALTALSSALTTLPGTARRLLELVHGIVPDGQAVGLPAAARQLGLPEKAARLLYRNAFRDLTRQMAPYRDEAA